MYRKKKKPRAVLLMIFLVFLGFYLKKKLVFLDFFDVIFFM